MLLAFRHKGYILKLRDMEIKVKTFEGKSFQMKKVKTFCSCWHLLDHLGDFNESG